jgi:hypothetical protein
MFSSDARHSNCGSTCLPAVTGEPSNRAKTLERKQADRLRAIGLDSPSGVAVSAEVSLETMTILLQNLSRWTVVAAPAVQASAAHGEWKGSFRDVIETIAASYGVVADIDEKAQQITLH